MKVNGAYKPLVVFKKSGPNRPTTIIPNDAISEMIMIPIVPGQLYIFKVDITKYGSQKQ